MESKWDTRAAEQFPQIKMPRITLGIIYPPQEQHNHIYKIEGQFHKMNELLEPVIIAVLKLNGCPLVQAE